MLRRHVKRNPVSCISIYRRVEARQPHQFIILAKLNTNSHSQRLFFIYILNSQLTHPTDPISLNTMPTAPNLALFGHRPVLQPTNTNTTPVNTSPAILPSKAGPRHIAQPTSSANSLTIHALSARPTALPVPLTTQSALPAIAQPTPAAVPASLTFHPVVQPTVAYTPHPGPLAAVSAFVATPPWGHSPFVDTPHPNPTLTTAPDPYATHSPGQSPLPAPNIPIDPRLLSQETQGSVTLVNNSGSGLNKLYTPRQCPRR